MKTFAGILCLVVLLQCRATRHEKISDFEKASFEKARINGEDASKFFMQNIVYPPNPSVDGYSDGSVYVSFIIKKTGSIDSIKVINEPPEFFKAVVLNAFEKSAGSWMPTRFDDLSMDKRYVAGFNFTATNSIFVKINKSFRYYKQGNMAKALKLIDEALRIDPYDIKLYNNRALIYKKQNKHELETLDLKKCKELNNILLFDIWFQANPIKMF